LNNSQFYLDFVYDEYLNNHCESKYLMDLISLIDWSNIPLFKNTGVGANGYSPRAMCKALFIKIIKNLSSVNELIFFLRSNPKLSQFIGFDPIRNKVPDESTFSKFRKSFNLDFLYGVISDSIFKGIQLGIFDTSTLCVDSYPIPFNSFFNNKKRFGKLVSFSSYYSNQIEADFGVKPISNDKPVYDKNGNPKKVLSFLGFKAHTVSFFNVPIFTVVSKASKMDIDSLIPLLQMTVSHLEFTNFSLLADKGYDSIKNYDFIHKQLNSTAFIPLRKSSFKPLKGKCGKVLSFHSKYFDKYRNHFRCKYICSDPSNCPLHRSNCYRYFDFSKDNFRMFLDRNSSKFKNTYKKRTLIESIFSSLSRLSNSTSLRFINSVNLDCNLANLFLISSALLAHSIGRDDLLASPKSLKYSF